MTETTLDNILAPRAVQKALKEYAKIRWDLKAFDGDRRGIANALLYTERQVAQEIINSFRTWQVRGAR
jgi:hypothetical protein